MIADAIVKKVLSLVSVVAITAALLCGYNASQQAILYEGKVKEVATLVALTQAQDETIRGLVEDLEAKPKEYIKIVKEVDRKVCQGIVAGDAIMNLKTGKGNTSKQEEDLVYEIKPENGYVDVDGKLPPELVRLLQ